VDLHKAVGGVWVVVQWPQVPEEIVFVLNVGMPFLTKLECHVINSNVRNAALAWQEVRINFNPFFPSFFDNLTVFLNTELLKII
jgi:hypothetical protein